MPDKLATIPGRQQPWYGQFRLWAALVALAVLAVVIGLAATRNGAAPQFGPPIVQLAGKDGKLNVAVQVSSDGRALALHASSAAPAGPNLRYQLWVIPEIGKPVSLGVLDRLDAVLSFATDQREHLRSGAALAISTEPAGGSTTGQPSGAVLLAATIGD